MYRVVFFFFFFKAYHYNRFASWSHAHDIAKKRLLAFGRCLYVGVSVSWKARVADREAWLSSGACYNTVALSFCLQEGHYLT